MLSELHDDIGINDTDIESLRPSNVSQQQWISVNAFTICNVHVVFNLIFKSQTYCSFNSLNLIFKLCGDSDVFTMFVIHCVNMCVCMCVLVFTKIISSSKVE